MIFNGLIWAFSLHTKCFQAILAHIWKVYLMLLMHHFGGIFRALYVLSFQFSAQNFIILLCRLFWCFMSFPNDFLQTDHNNFKSSCNLICKLLFAFLVFSNGLNSRRWGNPIIPHEIFSFHIWRHIPRLASLLTFILDISEVRQTVHSLCFMRLFQSIFVNKSWCLERKDSYPLTSTFDHVIFKRLICVFSLNI